MIYILLLVPFFVSSFAEIIGIKKINAKMILITLTVVLILFVGLRFHTGRDYPAYIKHFDTSLSKYPEGNFESGYVLVNKIFKILFNNYYVLQFAATCFICIIVYKFISRYSPYPIVSLTLFAAFFMTTILMAQVRQSIALGIIVIAAKYIFEKKPLLFFGMVVLACMFHISAVTAFLLYFFNRNYKKTTLLFLVIGAQIFYFRPELILSIIEIIAPFLPGRLSDIAIVYLRSPLFSARIEFGTGFYYIAQLLLNIFLVAFLKPKNNKMCFFC